MALGIICGPPLTCCSNFTNPPIVTTQGDVLFPVKKDGVTYYTGATPNGDPVFQWTQADQSQVRLIVRDGKKLEFWIKQDGAFRRVGAKEPTPEVPEVISVEA